MTADTDDSDLLRRCERFIFGAADLLDARDFESWLELFDDDGTYWLPVDISRTEPHGGLNLIFDDRRRLEDRIWRLRSGNAHTEEPPSRTVHYITNLRLTGESTNDGYIDVAGNMVVVRARLGETREFHARVSWSLRDTGDSFRIRRHRIDLIDADEPLPALTFLL
jgi:benzoate/toluate 1,2-dioxygenase beta subunit